MHMLWNDEVDDDDNNDGGDNDDNYTQAEMDGIVDQIAMFRMNNDNKD